MNRVAENRYVMNSVTLKETFDDDQLVDEERGPGLNKSGLSYLFLLLPAALLIWAGLTLMRPDILPVKHVRIEGEFRRLSPDNLQSIVIDTVRGGFFNVNVDEIKKILLDDQWVQQVTVRRIWPDRLSVQVSEQIAVAKWGEQGLINGYGEYFSPDPDTFPEGLPVLRGPENTYSLMLERYHLFQNILKSSGLIISLLTLNDRRAWTVQLANGPLLVLGKKNIELRMNRFATYLGNEYSIDLSDIERVDLRYTNGFSVGWKQNSSVSEHRQNYHG